MTSKPMDIRLKSVVPKAIWGCRSMYDKRSIVAIADYEFVVAVGNGIMIFDINPHVIKKTFLVNSHHNDAVCVTQMSLSWDSKYLATVVRMKNEDDHSVHILVYTIDHLRVEYRSPRLISYRNPACGAGGSKMEVTCVTFSHDSQYIALGTNISAVGVVVLDHKKGDVFQVIPTNSPPNHITFNPLDPCKLCITGNNGLFQFWRITAKSIHLAPVVGLRGHALNYTHHIWIPPFADGLVIAATSSGQLTIVMGGEQKGHNVHVFGQTAAATVNHGRESNIMNKGQTHRQNEHYVVQILVRGDVILALSPYNEVVAFEVRRVLQSKGINTLSPTLGLLKRYRLTNVDELLGIDWCIRDSATSFAVVGMSRQTVFQVEVIGDIDLEVSGGINSAGDAVKDAIAASSSSDWVSVNSEKSIFKFHAAEIHSLAMSARTSTLVTSSYTDATVRIWNFSNPSSFRGSWVVESFGERPQDNPFHVDMHPSGLLAACAVEGEVREYAVTDERLELYRRINIKGPFTGPTGAAHMVTQPVSLVKYSNGGQLIVVVTGKLAQVFNVNMLEYGQSTGSGFPQRVMIMCDHIAPITDVDFSRDDSRIITTSSDGCVYYWKVGAANRDQEYVFKGMSVNKVALSKTKQKETHIIAVCEAYSEHQVQHQGPAETMMLRRQSTVMLRRSARTGQADEAQSTTGDSADIHPSGVPATVKQSTTTITTKSLRRTYLAVWKDSLSVAPPQILALDSEVRCVALGETDGPDKFDICVLGTADGRILISTLPLPVTAQRMQMEVQLAGIPSDIAPLQTSHSQSMQLSATKIQATAKATSKRFRGTPGGHDIEKSRRGLLATQIEEDATAEPSSILTGRTSATDGDSTAASLLQRDRDEASMYSRQSSGSDAPHIGTPVGTSSFREATAAAAQHERLDENRCKHLRMHCGAVNLVVVSRNGMWIFSAGADGVVHMYATSKRALDMVEMTYSGESLENKFHMVDASKLRALRGQLLDTERLIETNKKDYDLKVDKILESKEKMVLDLKTKMQKEIKQRDEVILQSRNEYLKLKNNMNGDIAAIRKQCNDSISQLELTYEQKLSQESLYLDKMKQAYDEYVVHSRMDLAELQRRTDQRVEGVQADRNAALMEAEKQKKTVLQYFDYVKLRNDELMQSLEKTQVEERCKLKDELVATAKQLEKAQGHLLTGEVQANREVSKLQLIIEEKENDVLKLRSSVDWSQNRIIELEQALQKATTELGVRTEMSEKWELKTGEMQQKIIELEKLRKALTTQLHTLRQELGPKEESLMRVTEKLQETDREYELSLQAIADKEKTLYQKSENLNLLQKQVRDLRNASSRKEKVLRRAATLLDEYRFSLEQAYFKAEKRTIGGAGPDKILQDATASGADANMASKMHRRLSDSKLTSSGPAALVNSTGNEVVEIIAQNDGMKSALKRLGDILTPFLNEENTDAEILDEQEKVREEQDRHMYLLHRNVTGLRANLDLAQAVAANKVHNHLTDNQNLLKEVNNLRFEVRSLSMENQRLIAQLEFNNRWTAGNRTRASGGAPDEGSSELIFPQYHQGRAGSHNAGANDAVDLFRNRDSFVSVDSFGGQSASALEEGAGESVDSNRGILRAGAEYFSQLRGAAETVPSIPGGPKGFSKKVAKSASTPVFAIKAVHKDVAAEAAKIALDSTSGAANQYPTSSVTSKRSISGLPSYQSLSHQEISTGSQHSSGGGAAPTNKNEYARSADDKIAALIALNEQQIRSYKEEISKPVVSNSKSQLAGASSQSGYKDSLQMCGVPAMSQLNSGLESVGGGAKAVQLPSIRKNSNASISSKRR